MGRVINNIHAIVNMPDVARIQNVEQQRDETQRRQFALALQENAIRKHAQVQDSHKTESAEIGEKKEKGKNRKSRKQISSSKEETNREKLHIDPKIG